MDAVQTSLLSAARIHFPLMKNEELYFPFPNIAPHPHPLSTPRPPTAPPAPPRHPLFPSPPPAPLSLSSVQLRDNLVVKLEFSLTIPLTLVRMALWAPRCRMA